MITDLSALIQPFIQFLPTTKYTAVFHRQATRHTAGKPGKERVVCEMYGISIDESMGSDEFEYLVADNYNPAAEIPEGFVTKVIPAYTWAVFACTGGMPQSLQDVNKRFFRNGCRVFT